MPIPPLLILKGKDNGSPGVYLLKNGATVQQIGDDFGTLENFVDGTFKPENRVIVLNGEKYALQNADIHNENTGGSGTWGSVHTLTSPAGSDIHSGLYRIFVNDAPAVVAGYVANTGAFRGVYTLDGTTWEETTDLTPNLSIGCYGSAIVFKDKFFWWLNGSAVKVLIYNPTAGTADPIFFSVDTNTSNADFAIHNNNLYLIHTQGTTAGDVYELRKFEGGTFTVIHTFTGVNMGANGELGSACLFSDGTDLVAITIGANGDEAWRIQNPGEGSQSVTDVTSSVIPTIFQSGGDAETGTPRYFVFVDTVTDPANPAYYLNRLSGVVSSAETGQGGSYTMMQYTDTATELEIINEGPESDLFVVNHKAGGSEYIVGTDQNVYVELENFSVNSANQITFDFRTYGTATGLTGTLYYNVNLETPATAGTLTAVSGGSASISAGTIINIAADDGATLYSATWDATSDGAIPSASHIGLGLS